MPKITYTPGAVDLAEEKGWHLLAVRLDGKYAGRGLLEFTGPVGPKTAKRVEEFIESLFDVKNRLE